MVQAALDMHYAANLNRAKTAKQYPRQASQARAGQVIDATSRFASRGQRAEVIPLNAAQIPKAKNPVDEMTFKQQMAQKRHMDKLHAQQFALPNEFENFISQFPDEESNQMKDWYQDELEQGGLGDIVKEQLDKKFAKPIRDVVNKRIDELKEKAMDKVKEKAKEMFQESFKKIAGKGVHKAVWSAYDQGSIIEIEGAAVESVFGSGALLTTYQALTGALHGGKPLIPEGTILSFMEPPPLTVPSGKVPNNPTESVGMLIGMYDLLAWLLAPVYLFLLGVVALLIHVAIASTFMVPALLVAIGTVIYAIL